MINHDFVRQLEIDGTFYSYFEIRELSKQGLGEIDRLPYSIRILVENLLRKLDGKIVEEKDLRAITAW
jgi:aconitate hydratase